MKKTILLAIFVIASLCAFSQANGTKNSSYPKINSQSVKSRKIHKEHGYLPFEKNKKSKSYECADFESKGSGHEREMFVTANFSYSMKPSMSFGVTFGMMRSVGWFVSVMSSANYRSFNTNGEFDRNNPTETKPFLKGDSYRKDTRLSFMAGLLVRVARPVAFRIGAGYGIDEMCYETTDGLWFKDKVNCQKGIDTSLGIQFNISHFVVSADAVATNFKKLEAKIGLGYSF